MNLSLGIDTSNYRCSIAITDLDSGKVLSNRRVFLDVGEGKRGLRQSEAFFKQVQLLPKVLSSALEDVRNKGSKSCKDVKVIGISYAPRNVQGSYMPVFEAGVSIGKALSEMLEIPCYFFSHQEGHMASLIGYDDLKKLKLGNKIGFFHLSGGTTEFLLGEFEPRMLEDFDHSFKSQGFKLDIVGGSQDISMGQLIDRLGVKIGFPFPAGEEVSKAAFNHLQGKGIILENNMDAGVYQGWFDYWKMRKENFNIKLTGEKKLAFNLSGMENKFAKIFASGESRDSLSLDMISMCFDLLERSIQQFGRLYNINRIYMGGGVASSLLIQRLFTEKLKNKPIINAVNQKVEVIFAKESLSGDNAVGTSYLGGLFYG